MAHDSDVYVQEHNQNPLAYMSIQGLLVVKPTNIPQPGAVKTFTVNGNRIKSTPPDKGGIPYRIMSVTQAEYADSYGNLGFNVELDPQPMQQPPPMPLGPMTTPRPYQSGGTMSKDDYWRNKELRDLAKEPAIRRQHSQHMALLLGQIFGGIPSANTPQEIKSKLREWIDWFQKDIDRVPAKQQPPQPLEEIPIVPDEPSEIPY